MIASSLFKKQVYNMISPRWEKTTLYIRLMIASSPLKKQLYTDETIISLQLNNTNKPS